MGWRRMHAAFMLYKTLGYPELRYIFSFDIRYTYAVLLVNQDALSRSVIKRNTANPLVCRIDGAKVYGF